MITLGFGISGIPGDVTINFVEQAIGYLEEEDNFIGELEVNEDIIGELSEGEQ